MNDTSDRISALKIDRTAATPTGGAGSARALIQGCLRLAMAL